MRPLLALLDATSQDDFELRYTTRVALRNQVRDGDPQIFSQLESLKLTDAELVALLDITPAVATAQCAEFEIRHLDAISHDTAAAVKLLKHATKFASSATVTDEAVSQIRKLMPDELEEQLQLFQTIQQTAEERGQPITPGVRDWGQYLVTEALRETSAEGWSFHPAPNNPSPSPNPWQIQHRASADGNADALFWSSNSIGETLTGVVRSPNFVIPAKLTFFLAGHDGYPNGNGLPRSLMRLRSTDGSRVLAETLPPRNDTAQKVTWDLTRFVGQTGYIEGVDGDPDRAYAWLAFGRFDPPVVTLPKRMLTASSLVSAIDIARTLKLKQTSDSLNEMISTPGHDAPTRVAAALALASFGSDAGLKLLGDTLTDSNTPDPLSQTIVSALSQVDSDSARQTLASCMATTPSKVQSSIARALVKTTQGAQVLLATIEAGHAPARLLQERAITDALTATDLPDVQKRIDAATKNLPKLSTEVQKIIDDRRAEFTIAQNQKAVSIGRGAKIFATNCTACHQLDGQGRQIGPQLNGIGTRGADRVIEDVLDPSRNVDPAFRYTTLVLKNGDVVTGLFRREDPPGVLVFVDATAKEVSVPKDKIQRRIDSNASLMPL
jgi:putative heme-binding domain-containing protein